MKRKKYKYSRGFGPDQGVWIAICGPFELACVDLSCFHVCILTLAYGRHPIWAIRFGLGAICPLIAWGSMVHHALELALDLLETKYYKDIGDLGFEPRYWWIMNWRPCHSTITLLLLVEWTIIIILEKQTIFQNFKK